MYAQRSCFAVLLLAFVFVATLFAGIPYATTGEVIYHQKISNTEGGFTGILDNQDYFGNCTGLGDLDGDGVPDVAVGAWGDDDGGDYRGALWILFLNTDGTVKSHQKISATEGGFTGTLQNSDVFGFTLNTLGDLDGDGVVDLAVGAYGDDDGGDRRGAVWILFLNTDGTVKSHQKISDTQGGFTGVLDNEDYFGRSLSPLGDLDGDGVLDLAVGAPGDDDGPYDGGAVWILFLNTDGAVKSHQKIGSNQGGFTGTLDTGDNFGVSAQNIGDLDNDGVVDLAVDALWDNDGAYGVGAVWILFMNDDGTVKSHQKISATEGGFTGALESNDRFGYTLASLGDLDCDGVPDLAAGAFRDDDGGSEVGAVWLLFLNSDGTVKTHQTISATEGNFTGALSNDDYFSTGISMLGDLNGDGVTELAVGAEGDDDGGDRRGALWVMFLDGEVCGGDAPTLDIKPRSCPNPINVSIFENPPKNALSKKGGVLPAAVLGTEDFDVHDIDVSSIRLMGVSPLRDCYEDVATPVSTGGECDCNTDGPDGFMDLTLKFLKSEVAAAMGSVAVDEVIALTLTAKLNDGTPIELSDCMTVVGKRPELPISVESDNDTKLGPAVPNPFNPVTHISYTVPEASRVQLTIFDVEGRVVRKLVDAVVETGDHFVTWDATGEPSGVYFYRLVVGEYSETRKMILLK